MAEDISEARIKANLDRLRIVPPDTIREHEYADALFSATREPTSADETIQELYKIADKYGADKTVCRTYDEHIEVKFRGSSVDEGGIAIRTGQDEYVVHVWFDSWD